MQDKKTGSTGRKKIARPSAEKLNSTISSMPVPSHVLEHFEIWDAHGYKECRVIEMRKKECVIPSALSAYDDVVFEGYCNPIETLSHSFVCKPVCLRLFRRRYKRSNRDEHHSNEYGVTLKDVKMVPELGVFKEDS